MKNGFTLAEVLITLGIIGVVAALTLPQLVANYQKQVTVNKLKVAYSILYQVVEESKKDNGDLSTWSLSLTNDEFANRYILPYLKGWSKYDKYYRVSRFASTPNSGLTFNWGRKLYALSNGMVIFPNNDCGQILQIVVDINGNAKPNMMGKDVFIFSISKYKNILTPYGNHSNVVRSKSTLLGTGPHGCSRTGDQYSGEFCSALIMLEGWKISDEYPW